MATAADAWGIFDEDDAVAGSALDALASSKPASPTTTTPPVAPAPSPSPSAPPAPRALVQVPLERTLPDVVQFFGEHAEAAVSDLHDLATRGIVSAEALEHGLAEAAALVKEAAAAGARGVRSSSEAAQALCARLVQVCSNIVDTAWGVLLADRSWPHVAFREAYAMGQLARACCLGAAGDARAAMAAVDLALIMGAPAEEIASLTHSVELGAVMAAGAAAVGKIAPPPLPAVPRALGPSATLDATLMRGDLSPHNLVPRAVAYTPRRAAGGASLDGRRRKKGPKSGARPAPAAAAPSSAGEEEHPTLQQLRSQTPDEGSAPSRPLSLAAFRERFRNPRRPVVLQESTSNWTGADRWRSLEYLSERLGHRTVPVELGQHLSGSWAERPMHMQEFLERYVAPSLEWGWGRRLRVDAAAAASAGVDAAAGGPLWRLVGARPLDAPASSAPAPPLPDDDGAVAVVHPAAIAYLAQHTLFDQVPSLLRDLELPVYAEGEVGSINAWFGTAGTVTRCHFDTYENLLTQVWGYKFVRLFPPEQSCNLYPIRGGASGGGAHDSGASAASADAAAVGGGEGDSTTTQGNISAVDVEAPDLALHPRFAEASGTHLDAVLGPGDALYIPAGWWHYVRSITPSFTVNFWF